MAGKLKEKVAVITGAGSGMGEATAVLFAHEGAKVVVFDWNGENAARTAAKIGSSGGLAAAVIGNVAKRDDIDAAIRTAVDRFGRLDIMVNNAGVNSFADFTEDETSYDRTMDINSKGVFNGTSLACQQFIKQGGGGAVVNTASVAGLSVSYGAGPSYVCSKHAVIGTTKVFAKLMGSQKIRVNAVCPGGFDTPMNADIKELPEVMESIRATVPMQRWGKPIEIANAILFLASDEASFITGVALPVDGGLHI